MPQDTPPVTFSTFVISLASSGMAAATGMDGAARDLPLARQTLSLLDLLNDKTKGNLDEEEQRLLDAVREELRGRIRESGQAKS